MTSGWEVWKPEKEIKPTNKKYSPEKRKKERKKERKSGDPKYKRKFETEIVNLGSAEELVDQANPEVAYFPIYCGGFLILHDSKR